MGRRKDRKSQMRLQNSETKQKRKEKLILLIFFPFTFLFFCSFTLFLELLTNAS